MENAAGVACLDPGSTPGGSTFSVCKTSPEFPVILGCFMLELQGDIGVVAGGDEVILEIVSA